MESVHDSTSETDSDAPASGVTQLGFGFADGEVAGRRKRRKGPARRRTDTAAAGEVPSLSLFGSDFEPRPKRGTAPEPTEPAVGPGLGTGPTAPDASADGSAADPAPDPATAAPKAKRKRRTETPTGEAVSAEALAEVAARPTLFEHIVNLDVHLHSPTEAVANISGADWERSLAILSKLLLNVRLIRNRRVAFPTSQLDRLLCVRQPSHVTLDAAAACVAKAIWAEALGFSPLIVERRGRRIVARSNRWPTGWRIVDAPWTAVAALDAIGVPYQIAEGAERSIRKRLASAGRTIATASLAGTSVALDASNPQLLESLGLPALTHAGESGSGRYRLPLLAASPLLDEPSVTVTPDAAAAIKHANREIVPCDAPDGFPWTLYGFQRRDLATSERIVTTTGGVLLAGTMGTGKTTVALALAEKLDCWPMLVVAPLAAFSTWMRQLEEMGRSAYLATEPVPVASETILNGSHDAVIISYDRLHQFVDVIDQCAFKSCFADEVQRIRTPGSRRSRALRSLAAHIGVRVGMSGTPITNRAEDVLPIGAFLAPGEWRPRLSYADLEELYPGGDPIESLAEHLGTLMVRRRMEDTGVKLPDRHTRRVFVPLTPDQRRALEELEEEARAAQDEGELDERMHVFARLTKMRQIVNVPSAAGVAGPNPKVVAAIDLAEEYASVGRKSVIFVADRPAYTEATQDLDARGIGWVGIWGSTPVPERLENEKRFHSDDNVKVFIGTLAACSEALTLSPTATVTIFAALSYSPSAVAQAAARAYRMNTTSEVEEMYLHATAPGGTLDDRIWEILEIKRALAAQVVDRTEHTDATATVSLEDLQYMVTGRRDNKASRRAEAQADVDAERERKRRHARGTLYKRRTGEVLDDGAEALTLEQHRAAASVFDDDPAAHDDEGVYDDPVGWDDEGDDDGFDSEPGDD